MSDLEKKVVQALQRNVRKADLETTSLKSLKRAVVAELQLAEDFFSSAEWKQRSKEIINHELQLLQNADTEGGNTFEDVGPSDQGSDIQSAQRTGKNSSGPTRRETSATSPQRNASEQLLEVNTPKKEIYSEENNLEDFDSELSDVLDEVPQRKVASRKKSKSQATAIGKQTKQSKVKTKGKSSNNEDIATLKSQLLKCGIRKQWARILDPLPSDKDRTEYLKRQLESIGMTGRFSLAKAKKIKEQREFSQDMQDLQQDAENFLGTSKRVAEGVQSDEFRSKRRRGNVSVEGGKTS